MKSNSENPIYFFESLDEDQVKQEINKLLIYYDFPWYKISLPHEIRFMGRDSDGKYVEEISTVKDMLNPLLKAEFENSKKLLKESYLQNNEDYNKKFLRLQFNSLQALIRNKSEFFNIYPFFLLPIRGLVKFINERLLIPGMEHFTLNEDCIKSAVEDSPIPVGNDKIIDSILSYMKGKNEKQELILSNEDYQILVKYTTHLVLHDEVPVIQRILVPKLSNDVIRFTFWVLHRELYTTKSIRPHFYKFLKDVFAKFKNNEISSIKKQFGTKSRVPRHKFLPEIITRNLE